MAAIVIQDDGRERELIDLFGLFKDPAAGRGDMDAVLKLDGLLVPFELKSTTRGSITTVRDFSPYHVAKWKDKHWLIGIYDKTAKLTHCIYGSPTAMGPWIEEKAKYIETDFRLAEFVPTLITQQIMFQLIGKKTVYSLEDAIVLHKKQYNDAKYRERMDVKDGYSPERMLEILKDRCRYIIRRGSTLNNPHIPESYVASWEKIRPGDRPKLQELVKTYFASIKA